MRKLVLWVNVISQQEFCVLFIKIHFDIPGDIFVYVDASVSSRTFILESNILRKSCRDLVNLMLWKGCFLNWSHYLESIFTGKWNIFIIHLVYDRVLLFLVLFDSSFIRIKLIVIRHLRFIWIYRSIRVLFYWRHLFIYRNFLFLKILPVHLSWYLLTIIQWVDWHFLNFICVKYRWWLICNDIVGSEWIINHFGYCILHSWFIRLHDAFDIDPLLLNLLKHFSFLFNLIILPCNRFSLIDFFHYLWRVWLMIDLLWVSHLVEFV